MTNSFDEVCSPSKLPQLDRNELKIGAVIDGYCVKTLRWYEAKISDTRQKLVNGKIEEQIKVHFLGWNAKFDEWIDRNSERIAARGTSSSLVLAAAKV